MTMHRSNPDAVACLALVAALMSIGCEASDAALDGGAGSHDAPSLGPDETPGIDDIAVEYPAAAETANPGTNVVSPTPAGPNELLALVTVQGTRGPCSGVLIATDRVLTAGHCVCTDDVIEAPSCSASVQVQFRPAPGTGGTGPVLFGEATWHPDYNPSWIDRAILDDLAVVRLLSPAPSYAVPLALATGVPAPGQTVMITGYGRTGSGCNGPSGTLNYGFRTISGLERDNKILRFNDVVLCPGDSGGPILTVSGLSVYGINSSQVSTVVHGDVNKATSTHPYREWIKSHTCSSDFWSACDGRASMCQCGFGFGDCDFDSDCKPQLTCRHDVGATYGYPADADVCVAAGPVGGICACSSGPGNVCTESHDRCAAGFAAVCSPGQGTPSRPCGGCTCVAMPR
jgi:hypothetical protein